MELFLYFAKVSACTAVFYFFYHFILSRFTFFSFNRWYLIGTLVLSFIIPLLSVTVKREVVSPLTTLQQSAGEIAISNSRGNAMDPEYIDGEHTVLNQISLEAILMALYVLVFAILLTKLFIGIGHILWKSRNYVYKDQLKYVSVSPNCSFKNSSFCHYLFIDQSLPEKVKEQVIHHEKIHIKAFHFMDKLIAQLCKCVLWFNPFAYAYLNSIDANHEYEVDAKSVLTFDKRTYASLILNLAQPSSHLFINHFSKLPLKKRMHMLFKKPSNYMKKLIYLTALPLVIICCMAFINQKEVFVYMQSPANSLSIAAHQQPKETIKKTDLRFESTVSAKQANMPESNLKRELIAVVETKQISRINTINFASQMPVIKNQRTLVIDPGHGGKDGATKSVTGILEKDMTLNAAFILKEEAEKRGIRVVLTRTKDEYLGLYERRNRGIDGDAFISLHFNSMPIERASKYPNVFNGIEVYVSVEAKAGDKLKESKMFGNQVLKSLKNIKGITVRDSLKEQSLAVLSDALVPSILVEMGNISFRDSFNFVNDEVHIRKICNLILDGYETGC
ncbi:N-acetylmuramoyl-L-alanine amidase [Pedobacter cryophilus]|uniref:N-acetylmuramoyl-L-alanine amidase n=1 Tax=Pedobacter cryophilus TaxID=2571271 RepID=A0A4U1C9H6_9SPHI|nr:N-acetylmuramoyl-L-alanine amidase [Pedobacter cryophilus]TKC00298.1 N-acetylmuramoyl-L-alanine amidase [Pedobacter cryophilus]